jgi:hypothetical protein
LQLVKKFPAFYGTRRFLVVVVVVVFVVVVVVTMGFRGKPRMYLSLAGFLYRPLWTFQLRPLYRLTASFNKEYTYNNLNE